MRRTNWRSVWVRRSTFLTLVLAVAVSCREEVTPPFEPEVKDGSAGTGGVDAVGGTGGSADSGDLSDAKRDAPLDVTTPGLPDAPQEMWARDLAIDPKAPDITPLPVCGGHDEPCCPGNRCANGGCCMSTRCVGFGETCLSPDSCVNGSCGGRCGGLDSQLRPQPCCAGRLCTAGGTICVGSGEGTCQPCGVKGIQCCAGSYCDSGLACQYGTCN